MIHAMEVEEEDLLLGDVEDSLEVEVGAVMAVYLLEEVAELLALLVDLLF